MKPITKIALKSKLNRLLNDESDEQEHNSYTFAECFCGYTHDYVCWMHRLLAGYSKLLNTRSLTPRMLKIIDEAIKEVE